MLEPCLLKNSKLNFSKKIPKLKKLIFQKMRGILRWKSYSVSNSGNGIQRTASWRILGPTVVLRIRRSKLNQGVTDKSIINYWLHTQLINKMDYIYSKVIGNSTKRGQEHTHTELGPLGKFQVTRNMTLTSLPHEPPSSNWWWRKLTSLQKEISQMHIKMIQEKWKK